jgi:hypothetical protein
MTLILADGIDLPIALGWGLGILIPLMAFEVFVEAFVLRYFWNIYFQDLCRFTFRANCWSLLAGIPTKILNAFIYSAILPMNLPGFFKRYPLAISLGTLVYFAVTVLVEGWVAKRWRRKNDFEFSRSQLWRGILVANIATYAVVAPLYYFATKPIHDVREFTANTQWAAQPKTQIIFSGASDGFLKCVNLDGSGLQTIAPMPVKDFLVSADLSLGLFRGTNGNLYFFRKKPFTTTLVWQTEERYFMDQVAFSPSGDHVVFLGKVDKCLECLNTKTGKRNRLPLSLDSEKLSVAWSTEENRFFINGGTLQGVIQSDNQIQIEPLTNSPTENVMVCYGHVGENYWYSGDNWGHIHNSDSTEQLIAFSEKGLSSFLRISREGEPVFTFRVNWGLLHIAALQISDVAFVSDGRECLFECGESLYLLDIEKKKIGLLTEGGHFVLLSPRYQKNSDQVKVTSIAR